MRQVWISRVGPPEVLLERTVADPAVAAGEVRVKVKAIGVNFADVLCRLGRYPDAPMLPAVVGFEVSGVVDEIGLGVSRWSVGDAVIVPCRFGGYSDSVVVAEANLISLPKGMSFEQGTTLPVNYLTARLLSEACARVKAGDWVLIHSAAGGVGLALIDLCQNAGAKIVGLASSAKHAFLRDRRVEYLLEAQDAELGKKIFEITSDHGLDVIFNSQGGASWQRSMKWLAPFGRLCLFGFSDVVQRDDSVAPDSKKFGAAGWYQIDSFRLVNENFSIGGVNLARLWKAGYPPSFIPLLAELGEWFEAGKIRPFVGKTFPLSAAGEAHRYLQDRKNIGKVVLIP